MVTIIILSFSQILYFVTNIILCHKYNTNFNEIKKCYKYICLSADLYYVAK